jgi:predicted MFS family arabinose efflux permease
MDNNLFKTALKVSILCDIKNIFAQMLSQTIHLYKNAYNGLTRHVWLLSAVMLINRSGTMVLPFMTLYCTKQMHFTMPMAGVVMALYGLGSMAGAFIGGWLSDKIGFYRMQLAALFGGGSLFMLLGQMPSFVTICICTFLLSLVNESFRPANASAIAHYSKAENRTRSFALIRLATNIGWGVGSALGGFLASVSYHWLFWVDGATNIFAGILLLLLLPPAKGKPKVYIGFKVLFAICFFQLFTTVPLYFNEHLHLSEFWIGVVMSLNGVIIALFEMVIVYKLEGKHHYLRLITYGTVLVACSYFALNLPLASGLLVALLSTLLVTVGEMVAMPFMNSYYIARSNESNRGQYAALYTMAWSAAQAIGSSTGTLLAYRLGFANLWWAVGCICMVTALGYYAMLKKEMRP